MAVIEELIRLEDNGSISFGNYLMDEKKKVLEILQSSKRTEKCFLNLFPEQQYITLQ